MQKPCSPGNRLRLNKNPKKVYLISKTIFVSSSPYGEFFVYILLNYEQTVNLFATISVNIDLSRKLYKLDKKAMFIGDEILENIGY